MKTNMQDTIAHKIAQSYGIELAAHEEEALQATMECHTYDKEEAVVGIDQYTRHLYYIEQGMLRQYYYKDGKNISEHLGTEGELLFCIEALFTGQRSQLGIEAIEASTVWHIDYARFKELTLGNPGINALYHKFVETDLIISQRKADSWRFESSRERYERFCREFPEAARRASIAHIASYLLMSPETLSRVRAGLL